MFARRNKYIKNPKCSAIYKYASEHFFGFWEISSIMTHFFWGGSGLCILKTKLTVLKKNRWGGGDVNIQMNILHRTIFPMDFRQTVCILNIAFRRNVLHQYFYNLLYSNYFMYYYFLIYHSYSQANHIIRLEFSHRKGTNIDYLYGR